MSDGLEGVVAAETVVIAEASTGSPQAMAPAATSETLRLRALRWVRAAISAAR